MKHLLLAILPALLLPLTSCEAKKEVPADRTRTAGRMVERELEIAKTKTVLAMLEELIQRCREEADRAVLPSEKIETEANLKTAFATRETILTKLQKLEWEKQDAAVIGR